MAGKLLNELIVSYYAHLASVLIVYESSAPNDLLYSDVRALQDQFLEGVQTALQSLDRQHGNPIAQQWLNVWNMSDKDFELKMLTAVKTPIEGFITVLSNTTRFLAARYYATRHALLRYKDKYYLFLCANESPADFLNHELLQFYPQHIMVVTEPETNNDHAIRNHSHDTFNNQYDKLLPRVANSSAVNFALWTQRFVGRTNTNRIAVHLDTYITRLSRFRRNSLLFANKLLNLEERVIRLGSITYIPYVLTDYAENGKGNVYGINSTIGGKNVLFIGSEAELMRSFCQLYNCHLKVLPYGIDNWGLIFDNGTGVGMLGGLYSQHTEVAIGCIYNWYDSITETSHVIARSAVTILGPGPSPYPRWRIDLMPFQTTVWYLILMTLVLYSILLHFVKLIDHRLQCRLKLEFKDICWHFKTFERTLFNMFGVFIQQPSPSERIYHRFVVRICLAVVLMASITLQSIYGGKLSSLLTMPMYMHKIDSSEKWSLTNWRWSAPSIIWVTSIEKSDLAKEQRLTQQFVVNDHQHLYEISFSLNYGLGIERLMSGSFSFGKYITPPALETKIILKDDLYYDWTRAVAIRGWPLMQILNRHILHCMEAGLFLHWERKMVAEYLDHQTQQILLKLSMGYQMKQPPQQLAIGNISAALFILLFGNLSGFITFVIENASHKLNAAIRQ